MLNGYSILVRYWYTLGLNQLAMKAFQVTMKFWLNNVCKI